MKVKFKTLSAGPSGVIRPGDTVEVSDSEAKLLIDGGYAESAEPKKDPAPEAKPEPSKKKSGRK